jgi:receptor expression-enhancing protein 5/6
VGVALLSSLVGFIYPAFKSFQAIETKNKGDDTQWLVYWVIFCLFSIIEVLSTFFSTGSPLLRFQVGFLALGNAPSDQGCQVLV